MSAAAAVPQRACASPKTSLYSPRFVVGSSRGKIGRAIFLILMSLKAMSVMTVGIGMKLALLDPLASGFYSSDQRLLVGLTLFFTFGLQMLLKPLHNGSSYYTSANPSSAPRLFGCLVLRVGLISSMLAVSTADLLPHSYMGVQAALSAGAVITMRVEYYIRHQYGHDPGKTRKFQMMATHEKSTVRKIKLPNSNDPQEVQAVAVSRA